MKAAASFSIFTPSVPPMSSPVEVDRARRADVGLRRHRRDVGGLGDEGAGRGRAGAVGRDVDDDRHRRLDDVLDDLAHRALEPARGVEADDRQRRVLVGRLARAPRRSTSRSPGRSSRRARSKAPSAASWAAAADGQQHHQPGEGTERPDARADPHVADYPLVGQLGLSVAVDVGVQLGLGRVRALLARRRARRRSRRRRCREGRRCPSSSLISASGSLMLG